VISILFVVLMTADLGCVMATISSDMFWVLVATYFVHQILFFITS